LGASGGFPRIKEILENYLPYPGILLKAVLGFPQKFTGQKRRAFKHAFFVFIFNKQNRRLRPSGQIAPASRNKRSVLITEAI